jgi:hypothetical protein
VTCDPAIAGERADHIFVRHSRQSNERKGVPANVTPALNDQAAEQHGASRILHRGMAA